MRNYLPLIKLSRWRRVMRRPYWVACAVIGIAASLVWVVAIRASGPAQPGDCSLDYMNDTSVLGGQNFAKAGWNDAKYHYQPIAFVLVATDKGADPGSYITSVDCTGPAGYVADKDNNNAMSADERGLIDTDPTVHELGVGGDTKSIKWNNGGFLEEPIGVELGVSPDGPANNSFNNNGAYLQADATANAPKHVRPPVFMRNFASAAAFVDDGGRALINPLRTDNTTAVYGDKPNGLMIWCSGISSGTTPPGQTNCAPDISSYPASESAGAGYMLSGKDCHLDNPDNGFRNTPGQDEDGYTDGHPVMDCTGVNKPAGLYNWYMNYRDTTHHLFTGGEGDTDLTKFIGCVGGMNGQDCAQRINSFKLQQSARQTFAGNFAAVTVLTFRYPLTATVALAKHPDGAGFIQGNQYTYTIDATRGSSDPIVHDLTIVDQLPAGLTPLGGCANPPTTISGNTVTWKFKAAQLNALNSAATGYHTQLCVNFRAVGTGGLNYQTVTNTAGTAGSIGHANGNLVNIIPSTVTDYIYSPQYPFLTTSGGDVHAGGGLGFSINCNSGGTQQVNGTGGASQGSYVVSAGSTIAGFGSNGNPTDQTLQAQLYGGICRPNMEQLAYAYALSNPTSSFTFIPGAGTALGQLGHTYGPKGGLLIAPGDVTISSATTINSRVTLWVGGDLYINADIAQSGGANLAKLLGSFGVIVHGNIYIKNSVTSMQGYYFADGQIDTCTDGNIPAHVYDANSSITDVINNCSTIGGHDLKVSGLLSANSFIFSRVYNGTANGLHQTEAVNYLGLLFVAPPPVFDGTVAPASGLTSQEEAPPQY